MREVQAPFDPEVEFRVFLAGSIEMGAAENWQTRFVKAVSHIENLVIFNPRRDDWDSSWVQSINDPQFNEQVTWELDMLEVCDLIVLYFDPATKSPISLLELGLHAKDQKLVVCCPESFWRRGNVEMVCERHHIPFFESFEELTEWVVQNAQPN